MKRVITIYTGIIMHKQTLLFLHIPKTARMTFRRVLEKIIGIERTVEILCPVSTYTFRPAYQDPEISVEEFRRHPMNTQNKIRLMEGHFRYGVHNFINTSCQYVTFLRDPIDRFVSNYYYQVGKDWGVVHARVKKEFKDFDDYMEHGIERGHFHPSPLTRWLCDMDIVSDKTPPAETLKMALNNIERDFLWVGICESFDESMLILKKKMNWNHSPVYSKENTTKKRPGRNEVSQKTRDLIKNVHSHDYILFDRMREQLQLDISGYGADLTKDLAHFREMCSLFQKSRGFADSGDDSSAAEVLIEGLKLEPHSPDFLYDLSSLKAKSGQYAEALTLLSKGLHYYPNNTRMMRKCVEIFTALGQKEDAEYFSAQANA